ncbi:MAG: DUF4249 domain-containing protein [Bacteroidota bacterium]
MARTELKYVIFFSVLLLGSLCQSSCVDSINLTLEDTQEFLVVDGDFSTSGRPHQLSLYYATGQRTVARRPVEGATVTLVGESGEQEDYVELGNGMYELQGTEIQGQTGKSYQLTFQLSDGQSYESVPDVMPTKIDGDSIFFDYTFFEEVNPTGVIRRPQIEAYVATPLPAGNQDYWMKWEVTTFYSFPEADCGPFHVPIICYFASSLDQQNVNLLSGDEIVTDYLPRWKVAEKLIPASDMEFRGRHYFLVNQQSITQAAHEYWRRINLIANQTGSIFDAPPAAVPGNIRSLDNPDEVVLGFFELANTDSLRNFVTEGGFSEFYKFTNNVCADLSNPFANNNRFCCACQRLENATTQRPSWW